MLAAKTTCLFIFLVLLWPAAASAQVIPDSVATPPKSGKGAIKSTAVRDSLPPSADQIILLADTPRVDSIPTDTTIGPVRKRKAEGTPKLKAGQDRPLPDPKIAVRRSLILPGFGQAYNRSWWKIPIVYGGFGVFTYFIIDQNKQYQIYRRIAVCKGDVNCDADVLYPDFALFDIGSVIARRDYYRRNRDFNVILATLWYTLQAIDAYVEAHLKGFNVSNDLSLHLKPSMDLNPFRRSNLMMGATLSIKLHK